MEQRGGTQVTLLQQCRISKYLQWRSISHQPAFLQKQNTLRESQREVEIMGDKEQNFQFGQAAQVFHKGDVRAIVLPGRWLVKQQNFAVHRAYGGASYALLLSKTQRGRRARVELRDIQD